MSCSPDAFRIRQPLLSSGGARIWSHLPETPSSVVKDIDPVVENAILRCLQKDPALRPSSVRQVAAAFPGGDPLAAALAAGETPSPEMVAASGETEGLRPAGGLGFAGRSHCGSHRGDSVERTNHALPARAARKTAGGACRARAGYSAECRLLRAAGGHGDRVLRGERLFLRYIAEHDKSKTRWDNLETGAFVFWYRGSPRPLAAANMFSDAPGLGIVWTDDPPLDVSGMTLVKLNPLGRLTQLIAVPPQVEKPAGVAHRHRTGRRCSLPRGSIRPSGRQRSRCGRLLFIATRALRGQDRWPSAPISRCGSRLRHTGASLSTSS